jgi:mannosyltransferase
MRESSGSIRTERPVAGLAAPVGEDEQGPARRSLAPAVPLLALLVIGAVLRLVGITRQSLWLDEAFSVFLAAHPFRDILAFVASSDAHPPLYYLVLHVWMVFGPSVLALRLLSALASIAALLPMFLLGRRLANQRVALLATALLALSAFQVWYAQEVRMYALTTLAVLVAIYGLIRARQGGGVGSWMLFTGAMLTALYLDYSAFYVYSALAIWFVMVGWQERRIRIPFILSSLALLLGYLPWLPALWKQLGQIGGLTAWIAGANGTGLPGVFTDLFFNRTNLLHSDIGLMATLAEALSLVLVAAAFWLPRRAPAYPLLAFWLGWPCVLGIAAEILNHPILIARNMMVVEPALFLLLALAAEAVWEPRVGRRPVPARLALLVICLGIFIITNVQAQAASWNTTVKEDWRGAAALVAANERQGDLLLFNAYFTQMPFDYYYHRDVGADVPVIEQGYHFDESLLYANFSQTGKGIQSGPNMAGYARVWLVLSHTSTNGNADVPPWLAGHYRLARQWQFVGITVLLYQAPFT